MKICRQCGESISDTTSFCSRCGARQSAQAPAESNMAFNQSTNPPQENVADPILTNTADYQNASPAPASNAPTSNAHASKKKRTGLIIALSAILLVAALAVTLLATGAYASLLPHSRLKLGLAEKKLVDKAMDDFFERYEAENGVSASLALTFDGELDPIVHSLDSDLPLFWTILNDLSLDVSLDTTGDVSLLGVGVGYMGNNLLNATVVSDENKVGLYIPAFDSNYYTMSTEALLNLLNASMDDMGLDSSPDVGDILKILTLDMSLDEAAFRKDVMKMLEILSGISTSDNTKIIRDHTISLLNGDMEEKVALYVITPTSSDIERVLNDLVDYWDSGDCYIMNKLSHLIETLYEISTAELLDTYDEPMDYKTESVFDKMRAEIPDIADEIVNAGLRIEIAMKGNEVVSQRIIFVEDDVELSAGYDRIEDNGETRAVLFSVSEELDGLFIDLTIIENGSIYTEKMEIWLHAGYDGVTFDEEIATLECTYDANRKSILNMYAGEYSITVSDVIELSVNVAPNNDGMDHTFTFNFIDDDRGVLLQPFSQLSLNVFAKEGSSVTEPAVTATDVSEYTADELEAIISGWRTQFYMLLYRIFDR